MWHWMRTLPQGPVALFVASDSPLCLHKQNNFPSEWLTNQHRDTYATHLGHHDQVAFFAVAQNDAVGRVRYQLLEVRV